MITKTKQNWSIGQTVKVGFLCLVVRAAIATPGDHAPDAYLLTSQDGSKLYKFVPHRGIERLEVDEARRLIAEHEAVTARAFQRADELARSALVINTLFAASALPLTEVA